MTFQDRNINGALVFNTWNTAVAVQQKVISIEAYTTSVSTVRLELREDAHIWLLACHLSESIGRLVECSVAVRIPACKFPVNDWPVGSTAKSQLTDCTTATPAAGIPRIIISGHRTRGNNGLA